LGIVEVGYGGVGWCGVVGGKGEGCVCGGEGGVVGCCYGVCVGCSWGYGLGVCVDF